MAGNLEDVAESGSAQGGLWTVGRAAIVWREQGKDMYRFLSSRRVPGDALINTQSFNRYTCTMFVGHLVVKQVRYAMGAHDWTACTTPYSTAMTCT